jgi:hypothetical protein
MGAPKTGDGHEGPRTIDGSGLHLFEHVGGGMRPGEEQSHVNDAGRVVRDPVGLDNAGGNTV